MSKASSSNNGTNVKEASVDTELADSVPINFDTFVPTHDPSLAAAVVATGADPSSMTDGALGTGAEAAMVSQDEAFSRAMTAMYWSGYWTAVYHVRVGPFAPLEQGRKLISAVSHSAGATRLSLAWATRQPKRWTKW